jgi:hypothetical protein
MINLAAILLSFRNWCTFLAHTFKLKLMSRTALEIENIALRSQLSLFQQQTLNHKISKPQLSSSSNRKPLSVGTIPRFDFIGLENQSIVAGQPYPIRQLP